MAFENFYSELKLVIVEFQISTHLNFDNFRSPAAVAIWRDLFLVKTYLYSY